MAQKEGRYNLKYPEKTLYAAQGLSLPNYPHDLSGRDVSLGLTPAEVDSWKDMEDDWTSLMKIINGALPIERERALDGFSGMK